MTDDTYENYPKSITEIKADKTKGGAGVWTVRDCLIAALRDIDSGEKSPTSVAIIFVTDKDNTTKMHYMQRCDSRLELLGMYARAIHECDR